MGARPFGRLTVRPALDPRLQRGLPAQRGEHLGAAGGIVAGSDHVADAQHIGLIFLSREKLSVSSLRARCRIR